MIGKVLSDILIADSDVSGSIGDRVYPLVAEKGSELPLLIYNIESITPKYTKNDLISNECLFSVKAGDSSYSGVTTLIYYVRKALELVKGTYSGVTISKMKVTGLNEDYDSESDAFIKTMSFECKINKF